MAPGELKERRDGFSGLPVVCRTCADGHFVGPKVVGDEVRMAVRCDHYHTNRPVMGHPKGPRCWIARLGGVPQDLARRERGGDPP